MRQIIRNGLNLYVCLIMDIDLDRHILIWHRKCTVKDTVFCFLSDLFRAGQFN